MEGEFHHFHVIFINFFNEFRFNHEIGPGNFLLLFGVVRNVSIGDWFPRFRTIITLSLFRGFIGVWELDNFTSLF
jgi:hypothetical protein